MQPHTAAQSHSHAVTNGHEMDVKPPTSYLHSKRKTDTGQLNRLQPALQSEVSMVVDADDMKQSVDMHQDLIEEMEYILNEFMSLQLFGVVECKCIEPKQLQFFANVHMDDTQESSKESMRCDNCHERYVSIFKCDLCGMAICSQCQTFIAEMQCLRAVMQHFMYAKDYRLKQQREQQAKMHQKQSDTMYTMPLFDHYADDDMYGFGMDYDAMALGPNYLKGLLSQLGQKLHIKASDQLESIFDEHLMPVIQDKITGKMCYDIPWTTWSTLTCVASFRPSRV